MATAPFELPKLDRLLAAIAHCAPEDLAEYEYEHVQEARTYLLGAMPLEYRLNLKLAREALPALLDSEARRTAEKLLGELSKN